LIIPDGKKYSPVIELHIMNISVQKLPLVLIFLILATVSLVAQDKSKDKKSKSEPPFDVKHNLLVLDSNDQYVENIKIADIKIFEDDVEQKLTSFVTRQPGMDLVLVVDNTGSLRSQLNRVQEAAALLIVNLAPNDRTLIVRFTHSAEVEIVEDWTSDKKKLIEAIREKLYTSPGASAVIDAVYLAVDTLKKLQKPDPSKRSAVVLISDCEDRASFYKEKQLFELLKGTGIQVFPIALTGELSDGAEYLMRRPNKKRTSEKLASRLAAETSGNVFILDKVTNETLMSAMTSVIFELRSQYLIGYTPTNQKGDEARKLRIEVADGPKGEKRKAFIRQTYFPPKN
jgi:VWFA-related protein